MASVNRVLLLGFLGKDPELRSTQSGTSVCNFSLATNERWKDRNGETHERVEWSRIIAWGKTGEAAAKYLKKGSQTFIEGRLQTREWEDKEGNKRQTTEVIADRVVFLGGGKGEGGQRREDPPPPSDEEAPPF